MALRKFRGHRLRELQGQTVLITGGSRGLGLALAEEFAQFGAKIAICARDEQELARARQIWKTWAPWCALSHAT